MLVLKSLPSPSEIKGLSPILQRARDHLFQTALSETAKLEQISTPLETVRLINSDKDTELAELQQIHQTNRDLAAEAVNMRNTLLQFFQKYNDAFSLGRVPYLGKKLIETFLSLTHILASHFQTQTESLVAINAKLH